MKRIRDWRKEEAVDFDSAVRKDGMVVPAMILVGLPLALLGWATDARAYTAGDLACIGAPIGGSNVVADCGLIAPGSLPTGTIVGNSDTQTLTNKTISGSSNTLLNIGNGSLTNSGMTIGGQAISLGGATTNQGTGTKLQTATGSASSGDVVIFSASGATMDSGTTLNIYAPLATPIFTGNISITSGSAPSLSNGTFGAYSSNTLGAILTGQGSLDDVTIKNSGGTTVLTVPTGTTNIHGGGGVLDNVTMNANLITAGALAAANGGAGTITGALRANGSGLVTQAACADLSDSVASCDTNALNATNISSGILAFARMPTIGSGDVYGNTGGGSAIPGDATLTSLFDLNFASTQGDILYRNGSTWTALGVGTSGKFLQTLGGAANPQWASVNNILTANSPNSFSASVNQFYPISGYDSSASTSESLLQQVSPEAGSFTALYANLRTAPGTGNSVVVTLRKNGASPGSGLTCTISNTNPSCNDTSHTVTAAAGDLFDMQWAPSAATSAVGASAGLIFASP